jgi:hypothetical protein
VTRKAAGVKSGKRCVAPPKSKHHKKLKKCTRTITVGRFSTSAVAGADTLRFSGRVGGKKLRPGTYELVANASDATGKSVPETTGFRIVK